MEGAPARPPNPREVAAGSQMYGTGAAQPMAGPEVALTMSERGSERVAGVRQVGRAAGVEREAGAKKAAEPRRKRDCATGRCKRKAAPFPWKLWTIGVCGSLTL